MPKFQDNEQVNALLAIFATKLKDVEERHNLLKERVELLNRTFLSWERRNNEEMSSVKEVLREIKSDTEKIKDALKGIVSESGGFARKEELKILERYMQIWEPLKFMKEEEVKKMIEDALKGKKDIIKEKNLGNEENEKKEENGKAENKNEEKSKRWQKYR